MTPKEKAIELVNKLFGGYIVNAFSRSHLDFEQAKRAALITVEEIIQDYKHLEPAIPLTSFEQMKYWQEVKQEIEKL